MDSSQLDRAAQSDVSSSRPNVSVTLPRNFMFHYKDGQPPRTPEPEERQEPAEPPEPPRQTYRVRRRRRPALELPEQLPVSSVPHQDVPLPSIETSLVGPEYPREWYHLISDADHGYLQVLSPHRHFMSPPKTPVAQISRSAEQRRDDACWDHIEHKKNGESIRRPSSASSVISDSSVSSEGSFGSYPSFGESCGGSCTSPESEIDAAALLAADPFSSPTKHSKMAQISPMLEASQSRPLQRQRTHQKPKWLPEMDHHLWMTYLVYLQDPTLTPFKMLPGTAPPLGVCSRVAREAKRTWRGVKSSGASQIPPRAQANSLRRADSPDTIRPNDSEDSTPTGPETVKVAFPWPRSESATRRRLRELCKKKPSLSAHYQRLIHTKSPSPFHTSSNSGSRSLAGRLSSPFGTSEHRSAFSTRDMTFSLATSTASSMQGGGLLSQLASDASLPVTQEQEWFGQPVNRGHAHHKSQSLQLGLGIGTEVYHGSHNPVRPVHGSVAQFGNSTPQGLAPSSDRNVPGSATPKLAPPAEIRPPLPLPRSFKRRALYQLGDVTRNASSYERHRLEQEVFGDPADTSHRRVRSRGFSLGDMGEGARRLSALFLPPADDSQPGQGVATAVPQSNLPVPPAPAGRLIRLGSPFHERPSSSNQSNTFPRAFGAHAFANATSFEERLGRFGTNRGSRRK